MGLDPRTRIAFVDESLSDAMRDPNTYLLGAAVCEQRAVAAVRANIASLRLKRQVKVHWHDEDAKRRMVIAETIARAPVRHLVVVREGRLGERPERQRKKCLGAAALRTPGATRRDGDFRVPRACRQPSRSRCDRWLPRQACDQ